MRGGAKENNNTDTHASSMNYHLTSMLLWQWYGFSVNGAGAEPDPLLKPDQIELWFSKDLKVQVSGRRRETASKTSDDSCWRFLQWAESIIPSVVWCQTRESSGVWVYVDARTIISELSPRGTGSAPKGNHHDVFIPRFSSSLKCPNHKTR